MNLLGALHLLLNGSSNLGPAPQPTPSLRHGNMVAPQAYSGTDTGFQHPQRMTFPQIDPRAGEPAYSGGLDVRQQNVPQYGAPGPNNTTYNQPLPVWRAITPPPFRPIVQGSVVPFNYGHAATAGQPPQMVNVPWSSQQVPYSQSLTPPKGY